MIRDGVEADIPEIVRMAEEFWKHTQFDDPFEAEMVGIMAEQCMLQELMVVLEISGHVKGFCCGVKGPLLANSQVYSGTEVAWWVDPDARDSGGGIELLRAIQDKAKEGGCKYWTMVFMQTSMPESIEKIYLKMGYNLAETSYTKRLM